MLIQAAEVQAGSRFHPTLEKRSKELISDVKSVKHISEFAFTSAVESWCVCEAVWKLLGPQSILKRV